MSWKATSYVKELTKGISHTEKLVLFVLADYHNTVKRICWPSMPTLANECLMSERTLQRHLIRLESKKFIQREKQRGGHNTTLYCFPELDQGRQNDAPRGDKMESRGDNRGDKTMFQGRQNEHANKEERENRLNLTGKTCERCNNQGVQRQLSHIPGPRLIPCPTCRP